MARGRPPWRLVISRKPMHHEIQKMFHLDLFFPDEAHFENPGVTTNKALSRPALWDFISGRGAQENPLDEGECALDVVPTNDSAADTA